MSWKIGLIGFGNMGSAMAEGALKAGLALPKEIVTSTHGIGITERETRLGISTVKENSEVAKNVPLLILSVKPALLPKVTAEIKPVLSKETVVISVVAGQTLESLAGLLGKDKKIIVTMPNTPALVGEGITAYCPGSNISENDEEKAVAFLESFGKAIKVQESWMPAVVAASGSSPAYIYMFIESLADAAVAMGMPRDIAYQFSAQAVVGSGKMVLESGLHPGQLKDMVCSPGGTTIEAVKVLEEHGFRGTVIDGAVAAAKKTIEMQK